MDNNDKLLKTVLNLHYQDNPKLVADAMKVIQYYCAKEQTNSTYEEVLKKLHDLMNDLPPNILLYFLTTVPLPKHEDGTTSTFSDLMKKSRVSVLDNMQTVLTAYINNAVPSLISFNMDNVANKSENPKMESKEEKEKAAEMELKPSSSKRKTSGTNFIADGSSVPENSLKRIKYVSNLNEKSPKSCMKLLEISAEYVVLNLMELRQFYNKKNKTVWTVVNKNICNTEEQSQCYKHIEDINRKLKWLRMIEAGHISVDVIKELYGNSEIFLKERHLYNLVDESAFTVSKELAEAIENFVNS